MNWLIDAQLPRKLAIYLCDHGENATHTLDLPESNRTSDKEICRLSEAEDRIVVTKDSDFMDSYLLKKSPPKLLVVSVGNISNTRLIELFDTCFQEILKSFSESDFIEVTISGLIIHQNQ